MAKYIPIIPALRRWKLENQFKVILGLLKASLNHIQFKTHLPQNKTNKTGTDKSKEES